MDKQAIPEHLDAITAVTGLKSSGHPAEGTILFDRYRVIREIGRGGMGLVLLANDAELNTDVALKLVPDLLVHDDEAIDDLKQEVLKGITLTHPGIVRTHENRQQCSIRVCEMER